MWTEITRSKYERAGRRYASDLADAEWRLIEPYMPAVKRLGRPRETDLRAVVETADWQSTLRPQSPVPQPGIYIASTQLLIRRLVDA